MSSKALNSDQANTQIHLMIKYQNQQMRLSRQSKGIANKTIKTAKCNWNSGFSLQAC